MQAKFWRAVRGALCSPEPCPGTPTRTVPPPDWRQEGGKYNRKTRSNTMCNALIPILQDAQVKSSWLKSLALAGNAILSGSDLSETLREAVVLDLQDIAAHIAAELESDLTGSVENLVQAGGGR